MVLDPQCGQNTAVAGTSMRQRGQLVLASSNIPPTPPQYPQPVGDEHRLCFND